MPAAALSRVARANRDRADKQLAGLANEIARQQGYPSIAHLVREKLAAGQNMAAISRECGLDKDWMSRHLARVDPAAAELARTSRPQLLDARWLPAVQRLGFRDLASYLRQRHIVDRATVNAIATEVGVSFPTVKAALNRHDIVATAHAEKRYEADRREHEVAAALGVESIRDYVAKYRALGWTWGQIAAESRQPETWLRRHAVR